MNEAEFWNLVFIGASVSGMGILIKKDDSFHRLMVKLEELGYKWAEGQNPTEYSPWRASMDTNDRTLLLRDKVLVSPTGTRNAQFHIKNAPFKSPVEVEII